LDSGATLKVEHTKLADIFKVKYEGIKKNVKGDCIIQNQSKWKVSNFKEEEEKFNLVLHIPEGKSVYS
jgi:hypothetical protein